jgi:thiol-disulfide isomerase/thioredoxin
MSELDKLQEMHSKLARAKFFYYEKHESIMTDYEFDIIEKEYSILSKKIGIQDSHSASEAIGSKALPRNLNHFYKEVFEIIVFTSRNCPPCKKLLKILDTVNTNGVVITKYLSEDNKELCNDYGVKSNPTVVYLNDKKEVITKSFGSTIPFNLKYIKHFG